MQDGQVETPSTITRKDKKWIKYNKVPELVASRLLIGTNYGWSEVTKYRYYVTADYLPPLCMHGPGASSVGFMKLECSILMSSRNAFTSRASLDWTTNRFRYASASKFIALLRFNFRREREGEGEGERFCTHNGVKGRCAGTPNQPDDETLRQLTILLKNPLHLIHALQTPLSEKLRLGF